MKPSTESVLCSCGTKFMRLRGETYRTCLRCETSSRLEAAAIRRGSPGLVTILQWNAVARQRAGVA